MRGYRMARASHGVATSSSAGESPCSYYYEIVMLPGPSAADVLKSLPPNARLGPGLREKLQKAVEWEKQQAANKAEQTTEEQPAEADNRKRKTPPSEESPPPVTVGGHVRVGWSMRTGDLQAPVGYDKWSYGIRDTGGSILHKSQRQDHWGGEGFAPAVRDTPADVIGCAICLDPTGDPQQTTQSHIRFFKNGIGMGNFVLSKGKREGGEAFTDLESGTYYPAASTYMGGAVKVNFGPHWICPPRMLPPAYKKRWLPVQSCCTAPASPEEAVAGLASTVKLFRKPEHQQAFREAVHAEAAVRCGAYEEFMRQHVREIRQMRLERGLNAQDLPEEGEEETRSVEKETERKA
jgi:hypothetical protein